MVVVVVMLFVNQTCLKGREEWESRCVPQYSDQSLYGSGKIPYTSMQYIHFAGSILARDPLHLQLPLFPYYSNRLSTEGEQAYVPMVVVQRVWALLSR